MKEYRNEVQIDWQFLGIVIAVCFFLWMAVTVNIRRFKHPHLTETQLMMTIHKSIMLDFAEKE